MGVSKDDVAEYEIKKEARGDAEAAWPVNSLPPKPNITYIEANLYAKTHRIHLKIHTQRMHSHPITSDKNCRASESKVKRAWTLPSAADNLGEKRKSHLTPEAYPKTVSQPRSAAQPEKAVRYANSIKRTGR